MVTSSCRRRITRTFCQNAPPPCGSHPRTAKDSVSPRRSPDRPNSSGSRTPTASGTGRAHSGPLSVEHVEQFDAAFLVSGERDPGGFPRAFQDSGLHRAQHFRAPPHRLNAAATSAEMRASVARKTASRRRTSAKASPIRPALLSRTGSGIEIPPMRVELVAPLVTNIGPHVGPRQRPLKFYGRAGALHPSLTQQDLRAMSQRLLHGLPRGLDRVPTQVDRPFVRLRKIESGAQLRDPHRLQQRDLGAADLHLGAGKGQCGPADFDSNLDQVHFGRRPSRTRTS